MESLQKFPSRLKFTIFFSLLVICSHASVIDPSDCAITRYHGQGYTTSISSVTENTDGSHTIVLIVDSDGCSAPGCKKMNHYSVEADPGTYSNISVQTLSGSFTYESINYGPNIGGCPFQGFRINNTNGMGNGQAASFSITYTLTGGLQAQQTMVETSSDNMLVNFTLVKFQSVLDCLNDQNILPYYTPPDGGKVYDLIGAELTSLYNTYLVTGTYISDDIFQIVGSSVLIDIIVQDGKYDSTLNLLITPGYGLSSETGDPGQLIITGLFPIINLLSLNALPTLINYARPVFSALGNAGIVTSQGDTSMRSNFARIAFDLNGQGIKIGVLSDSYNTKLGDQASDDVLRGDLPGLTNPDNSIPVEVVKEYPYGSRSDEGRAMLQILHDVAPGAELAFRTGFLGAADFAKGIIELQQAGCDVIVEDITYISEPFYRDGIVARAVDSVTALGAAYFSAAGNFGTKSYQSEFYPVTAPPGITGEAHNFAGGDGGSDVYQSISLNQGNYTVVLQWDDGTGGNVTNSDFDIYLANENGSPLFGFNRVNTSGAPAEVLPFTVAGSSAQTSFIIIRSAGSGPVNLKYIIFRGDITINEYATPDASTLVGQANAEGAIAVGAVLYSNTPEFGVELPTVASFSSRGGTPVNGINRFKPEITAPNGVNTTVNLGGVNIDGDAFPNFFGTSAAAPHAAGVAALILEAKSKYYGSGLSPVILKEILQNTAIDMSAPGYDVATGAGFIQADAALLTLANPSPYITGISYDTTLIPGQDTIEITVYGQYLTGESQLWFNGAPLDYASLITGDSAIISIIPPFEELYPEIQVYNPPLPGTNGTDGGLSNPLYFTTKETILVDINDSSKKYSEVLPEFTASYTLESLDNSMVLDSAGLTPDEIDRIHDVALVTVAGSLSNAGLWEIEADQNDPLNPLSVVPATDSLDLSLLQRYNFVFRSGLLTIDKLDLVISPRDTTFTYGDSIGGFSFEYIFNNDSINPGSPIEIDVADSLAILSAMKANHATALVNGAGFVVATALVNAGIGATALVNKSFMISNATFSSFATALVNGTLITGPSFITATALVNTITFTGNTALAPATALVNNEVIVNTYDTSGVLVNSMALGTATALVNATGGATALVNTNTINASSNSDAIVILGSGDISILSGDSTGSVELRSVNIITGNTVGQHYILPGSFISNNFNISYGLGTLTILPDTATVTANLAVIRAGQSLPSFSASFSGFAGGDDESVVTSLTFTVSPTYCGAAGTYQIIPAATADNYIFTPINGTLYVNPYGNGAKQIKVSLQCIDVLNPPDSSGFTYLAHFKYENENATNVYIPIGADNNFSGNGSWNSINQPQLFQPGCGYFTVPFDGVLLKWTVKSYKKFTKTASTAKATSSSCQCNKSEEAEAPPAGAVDQYKPGLKVYPNPTTGRVYIELNGEMVSGEDISVYDIYGKVCAVQISSSSDQLLEIDLTGYKAGLYIVRINTGESTSISRIIKK